MTRLTRRQLLLHAAPLAATAFAFARTARAADSCVQPDSESLRVSLNYVTTAADASAAAGPKGRTAGASTGHCDSFSPPA